MKILNRLLPLALLFLIFGLLPSPVQADPVVITSGTISYSRNGASQFQLIGSGLSLSGTTSPLNAFVSLLGNGIVAPGQTRQTGGSLDSQDGELNLVNPVTVDGSVFSPGASLLVLNISSASFTAPLESVSGFVVVAPFMLTASLVEGYENTIGVGNPLFSSPLSGSGITILTYLRTATGEYQLFSQNFSFGTTVSTVTVSSVPEPVSLLLLGSGLSGLVLARRRRLKTKI